MFPLEDWCLSHLCTPQDWVPQQCQPGAVNLGSPWGAGGPYSLMAGWKGVSSRNSRSMYSAKAKTLPEPSFSNSLPSLGTWLLPAGDTHNGVGLLTSLKTIWTIFQMRLPTQMIIICGKMILKPSAIVLYYFRVITLSLSVLKIFTSLISYQNLKFVSTMVSQPVKELLNLLVIFSAFIKDTS